MPGSGKLAIASARDSMGNNLSRSSKIGSSLGPCMSRTGISDDTRECRKSSSELMKSAIQMRTQLQTPNAIPPLVCLHFTLASQPCGKNHSKWGSKALRWCPCFNFLGIESTQRTKYLICRIKPMLLQNA